MTRDDALAKLAHLRRRTYKLELEPGDGTVTDSKLGGTPYLPPGTAWPTCGSCQAKLRLRAQLNTAQLPEPLRKTYGEGMIQVFDCACSGGPLLRLVELSGDSETDAAPPAGEQSPRVIRGWRAFDDHPGMGERPGVELTDEETAALVAGEPITRTGDKLSGWPAWSGAASYPTCTDCGKRMRLVLQLGTEGGDEHLMQCPTHTSVLALA